MTSRLNKIGALLSSRPGAMRRYRNIDWQRVERLHFVCKGNICRSVYAEYRAKKIGIAATSSGVAAATSSLADPIAQQAAALRGIDLRAHRTRRFEDITLGSGDLVVAMEPWQAHAASLMANAANAQVTILGLWAADTSAVIADPYGGDDASFARCFAFIDRAVNGIRHELCGQRTAELRSRLRTRSRTLKGIAGRALFATQMHRLLMRRRAVVTAFHSVVPDGPGDALRTPLTAFDEYCRFFTKNFIVVSLKELLRRMSAGESIDRMLAVTFDDGYADNARLAAPVLNKYGIPATFFVTAGFIDSSQQAPWDARKGLRSEWMTWQELANLAAEGHDIEAHTMSHPEISGIDAESLDRELSESIALIKHHTYRRPTLFAVPFGRPSSLTPSVVERISAHGFLATVTNTGGAITPQSTTERLNRFPMNFTDSMSRFEIGFDILQDSVLVDRSTRPVSSRT